MKAEYYDLKIYLNDEMIMGIRQLTAEDLIIRIRIAKYICLSMIEHNHISIKNLLRFEVE